MSDNVKPAASVPAASDAGTVMLPPAKTQENFVHIGFTKANLSRSRAFVLAILAGMFVAMGASFMLMLRSDATLSSTASLVLGGLAFCLGLFLVLVAGAELFTGNCLMAIAVLNRKISAVKMVRKWALVYAGNAVGSLIALTVMVGCGFLAMNDGVVGEFTLSVVGGKCALSPVAAFARGFLCNMLVCIAVWMGSAGRTVCDKLAATVLPVVAFVALGAEHSVANMYFLPLGFVAQAMFGGTAITVAGALSNLIFVTLGNIVGGVAVAAAYWYVYGTSSHRA